MHLRRLGGNQLTIALVAISIIVFLLMRTGYAQVMQWLLMGVPGQPVMALWLHEPWRLLSPMFLHFGILHILFNCFWLYDLGSLIEDKEGKLFYGLFIIVASLGSGLLQFIMAGPLFGGMSGVVYALFGYLWISSKYNLRSGYYMSNQIAVVMLGWLVLCFTGLLGPVANFGHLGGLLVGMCMAWLKKYC